ncbi:MAG TPA: hypothetical protein VFE06_01595 [Acidobacteriaceae bacterium]|jgi:hypothetical protein|nr:hypothetical protein [Acidobacteriaceae bacterium]
MHLSAAAKFWWAAGFLSTAALVVVLLVRGRWREFPVLTAWFAFLAARTITLFVLYNGHWAYGYRQVYLTCLWLDFALQLGVAVEIARIVLRPTGTWVQDARARFAIAGVAGAVVAGLLAWWVSPPASTVSWVWRIRGNLFTSLVICELFVMMSLTANRLGLGWRNHVMAVGQGLTAWTSIMVVTTALQSFLGNQHLYADLDYVRDLAYFGAAIWIAVQLWIPEPERQPIAVDLQEYILALHRRVEYDLRRLDAPR